MNARLPHEAQWPPVVTQAAHFIGGRFVAPTGGASLPMIDPSSGKAFASIARGSPADVDVAVAAAQAARAGVWGRMAPVERGRVLMRIAHAITAEGDALALVEARDCGKPVTQARADVTACARYFEFYAGAADKLHGETIPYADGYAVLTWREPHGVTGHIVPWNYPLQIFGRSVAAALAVGNACVVKPAEDACLSLLRVASLACDAGLPPGALNVVTGLGSEAGAALASHPGVHHVSFTGSPATGAAVAVACAMRHCPVTLELGAKSPQIVFADADVERALPAIVNAIVQNAGQTCSAGSRLLVERGLYEALLVRLGACFAKLRAGPAWADLDCGPLICASQLARARAFIADARGDGLEVVAEGEIDPRAPADGYYMAPILVRDVPATHRLWCDEVFGPVLAAAPFDGEEDALRLANDSAYGLVAGVWTRDGARQLRVARALASGQVFINNYGAGGGVELPFGGVKHSGHGREKGYEALYGFTALKTVVLRHD